MRRSFTPEKTSSDEGVQARHGNRVLFVVPDDEQSPGPRYRVFQFLPHYAKAGLRARIVAVQGGAATRRTLRSVHASVPGRAVHYAAMWVKLHLSFVRVVSLLKRSDVLYLYRIPVPKWAAFFLVRSRSRIVFDFDDALDVADVEASLLGRLRRRVLRNGLRNAIRAARVTIASNRRNAQAVERLGGKSVVIPTCVDLTRYAFRERNAIADGPPVVGWIGSPSTSFYLAAIEEALARVRARIPFCVRLVGAAKSPFRSLEAEIRPWRLETEVDEIAAFDVGIMPMPESPWTSGKAALKALQYGASGAPTVASRTDTNVDILGADEGTLFASTLDEWTEAIARVVQDARLRGELGRRGRARVERFYSLEAQLPRLLQVIRDEPPGPLRDHHLGTSTR